MIIPKIIHQIWFQGEDELPIKYQKNLQLLKKMHPTWQYILWDEAMMENLIRHKYPQFLQVYENFIYMHQKIDFFKFVVLYDRGGIYSDIDTKILQPIDLILKKYPNKHMFVSKTKASYMESKIIAKGCSYMLNNGVIMSKPQHPFLMHLMKNIVERTQSRIFKRLPKSMEIEFTTGPLSLTSEICKYKNPEQELNLQILPHEYFEPCYPYDKHCSYTENTIIDHQHTLSWVPPGAQYILEVYFNYYYQGLIVLILLVAALFYVISKRDTSLLAFTR